MHVLLLPAISSYFDARLTGCHYHFSHVCIFRRQHWRVLLLCLLTYHLHLLCDLVGSHGPTVGDFWPICYSEPIFRHPIWIWKHQWRLDGWQNQIIFVVLFAVSLWVAVKKGYSFVEVVSKRADKIFVPVLRKWFGRLIKEQPENRKVNGRSDAC
jgi:hypothetical protein